MRIVRKWIAALLVLLLAGFAVSDALAGKVRGYYRRDGTYVQPHQRSNPDGNPRNNYGYPGNYNPNTGTITPGDPYRYEQRYYEERRERGIYGR